LSWCLPKFTRLKGGVVDLRGQAQQNEVPGEELSVKGVIEKADGLDATKVRR
jgi:hypothetical protein